MAGLRVLRKPNTTPTITPKKHSFVTKLSPGLSSDGVTTAPVASGSFTGSSGLPSIKSNSSSATAGSADPISSYKGDRNISNSRLDYGTQRGKMG